jgi:hypothetical protein
VQSRAFPQVEATDSSFAATAYMQFKAHKLTLSHPRALANTVYSLLPLWHEIFGYRYCKRHSKHSQSNQWLKRDEVSGEAVRSEFT